MVAWESRDFENYQINKYLEMLQPLSLTNMCITECEEGWGHCHVSY